MGGDLRRLRTEFRGQWAGLITLCMAVAVSAVSWPVVVGLRTGRATAFYEVQAVWGQRPEKGPFVQWLTWAWGLHGVFGIALVAGCLGAYIVLVAGRHGRWLPLEVRAWAYAYPLYLFAVVRPITSMWRFLVLDFPLAALVASVAMRTSTGGPIVGHWRRQQSMAHGRRVPHQGGLHGVMGAKTRRHVVPGLAHDFMVLRPAGIALKLR